MYRHTDPRSRSQSDTDSLLLLRFDEPWHWQPSVLDETDHVTMRRAIRDNQWPEPTLARYRLDLIYAGHAAVARRALDALWPDSEARQRYEERMHRGLRNSAACEALLAMNDPTALDLSDCAHDTPPRYRPIPGTAEYPPQVRGVADSNGGLRRRRFDDVLGEHRNARSSPRTRRQRCIGIGRSDKGRGRDNRGSGAAPFRPGHASRPGRGPTGECPVWTGHRS